MIVRNPNATRPFQHVLEPLVQYLLIAAKQWNDFKFASEYNIGPDIENCVCVKTLLDSLCKHFSGAKYVVNQDPNAKHEAKRLELDNSKVKKVFGYHTIYTIDATIKSIADWMDAYKNNTAKKEMLSQIDFYLDKL